MRVAHKIIEQYYNCKICGNVDWFIHNAAASSAKQCTSNASALFIWKRQRADNIEQSGKILLGIECYFLDMKAKPLRKWTEKISVKFHLKKISVKFYLNRYKYLVVYKNGTQALTF